MNYKQFIDNTFPEPNTGCWLWAGRINNKGYGIGLFINKIQLAHRYSYFVFNGSFDLNKDILHHCDTPLCVNPDHLYQGDQVMNNKDRDSRGRQRTKHGIEHKLAKLNNEQVREIRLLHDPKTYSSRSLAAMFGVSQRKILDIVNRTSWKHVE